MSKKNKPGYQRREARREVGRSERRAVKERADQEWLDAHLNDSQFCKQVEETVSNMMPCSLGEIAIKIGAPSPRAAAKILMVRYAKG